MSPNHRGRIQFAVPPDFFVFLQKQTQRAANDCSSAITDATRHNLLVITTFNLQLPKGIPHARLYPLPPDGGLSGKGNNVRTCFWSQPFYNMEKLYLFMGGLSTGFLSDQTSMPSDKWWGRFFCPVCMGLFRRWCGRDLSAVQADAKYRP